MTLKDDMPLKKMSDGWRLGGGWRVTAMTFPPGRRVSGVVCTHEGVTQKTGDSGFKGNYSSSSLGVQPLTGHTLGLNTA